MARNGFLILAIIKIKLNEVTQKIFISFDDVDVVTVTAVVYI